MKKQKFNGLPAVLTLLLVVLLVSCEKNQPVDDVQEAAVQKTWINSPLKAATPEIQGRNLAANCFQCHGTNGYAGELKIAGQSSSGIVSKFSYYRNQDPKDNIMNLHARGYTDAEIKLIADFISKQ